MSELSGAQQFQQLSFADQARYIAVNQQMARFARDHGVPIIFAPPRSRGGKINGASGSVLQMGSGAVIATASHVLEGYETRTAAGESLNWQVGNLPPFDPIPRIAWRSRDLDIVLLRITADEARSIGPCIISAPPKWPPVRTQEGQLVLVGGYPKALREQDIQGGSIGAGPYSAVFKVTAVGEGCCKCMIERRDLISFDGGPLPPPGTDMGGLSGGPVLLVDALSYPLVGVVTDRCEMSFAEFEILKFATLADVQIDPNA
jgi:Trypsin-like peptidase domain